MPDPWAFWEPAGKIPLTMGITHGQIFGTYGYPWVEEKIERATYGYPWAARFNESLVLVGYNEICGNNRAAKATERGLILGTKCL